MTISLHFNEFIDGFLRLPAKAAVVLPTPKTFYLCAVAILLYYIVRELSL